MKRVFKTAFAEWGAERAAESASTMQSPMDRPGGIVVFREQASDGSFKQRRLVVTEHRGKFFGAWTESGWNSVIHFHGDIKERSSATGALSAESLELKAEFPGKVRKILVSVGQKIKSGDPLILVEAMKMEFSLKAPASGTIQKIHFKEGDQVTPGQSFFEIQWETKK